MKLIFDCTGHWPQASGTPLLPACTLYDTPQLWGKEAVPGMADDQLIYLSEGAGDDPLDHPGFLQQVAHAIAGAFNGRIPLVMINAEGNNGMHPKGLGEMTRGEEHAYHRWLIQVIDIMHAAQWLPFAAYPYPRGWPHASGDEHPGEVISRCFYNRDDLGFTYRGLADALSAMTPNMYLGRKTASTGDIDRGCDFLLHPERTQYFPRAQKDTYYCVWHKFQWTGQRLSLDQWRRYLHRMIESEYCQGLVWWDGRDDAATLAPYHKIAAEVAEQYRSAA